MRLGSQTVAQWIVSHFDKAHECCENRDDAEKQRKIDRANAKKRGKNQRSASTVQEKLSDNADPFEHVMTACVDGIDALELSQQTSEAAPSSTVPTPEPTAVRYVCAYESGAFVTLYPV